MRIASSPSISTPQFLFCNHTGDAVSSILAVWWKREAICAACRGEKSALVLTAYIVFGVASGLAVRRRLAGFLQTGIPATDDGRRVMIPEML